MYPVYYQRSTGKPVRSSRRLEPLKANHPLNLTSGEAAKRDNFPDFNGGLTSQEIRENYPHFTEVSGGFAELLLGLDELGDPAHE